MGVLGDKAIAKSKFLLLDKGESAVVQYVGFKMVPNRQDPTQEDVLYEFKQQGHPKFWTNSSANVMRKMDHAQPGEFVRITREKKLKADGTEDPTKSKYVVDLLGDGLPPKEALPQATAPIVSEIGPKTQINGNPGGVTDPKDIKDPFEVSQ